MLPAAVWGGGLISSLGVGPGNEVRQGHVHCGEGVLVLPAAVWGGGRERGEGAGSTECYGSRGRKPAGHRPPLVSHR